MNNSIKKKKGQHTLLFTTGLLGITVSIFGYFLTLQQEKSLLQQEVNSVASRYASEIHEQIQVGLESLNIMEVLFFNDALPNETLFQNVAKQTIARKNDIKALEWIPKVTHDQRSSFESYHVSNHPNFTFNALIDGQMQSAPDKERYFPIYYVEPYKGHETAFGFDLSSSLERNTIIEASARSGKSLISGRIELVQVDDRSDKAGFLAMKPLYLSGTQHHDMDTLRGFVLGVFSYGALLDKALQDQQGQNAFHFELIDVTEGDKVSLYQANSLGDSRLEGRFLSSQTLNTLWGRDWVLNVTPTDSYIKANLSYYPYFSLGAGATITILLIMYLLALVNRDSVVTDKVEAQTADLRKQNKKLNEISLKDGLTQVCNRRAFDEYYQRSWQQSIKLQRPISILLFDIDEFKKFNDHYGHLEGDQCLIQVAQELSKATIRSGDHLCRYGGEEFVMILNNCSDPSRVANECLERIINLGIEHQGSQATKQVTVSIGGASLIPYKDFDSTQLIKQADMALYSAKEQGRNQFVQFKVHSIGNKATIDNKAATI
ncbi:diguanylate cyclase [Vibrio sp.]|nr:diguanylate cyclase [Vibrio sp.]